MGTARALEMRLGGRREKEVSNQEDKLQMKTHSNTVTLPKIRAEGRQDIIKKQAEGLSVC